VPQDMCFRHTKKWASYRCQQCSKPICDRCTVNARFCSRGCNEKYSTFIESYGGVVKDRGLPIGVFGMKVILMLLGLAAVWWLRHSGLW
jgi:hypothetical protein